MSTMCILPSTLNPKPSLITLHSRSSPAQVETLPSVYRAVVLPYQGRQYSAVAVLPDPGVSLQDTVTALSSAASQANKVRAHTL